MDWYEVQLARYGSWVKEWPARVAKFSWSTGTLTMLSRDNLTVNSDCNPDCYSYCYSYCYFYCHSVDSVNRAWICFPFGTVHDVLNKKTKFKLKTVLACGNTSFQFEVHLKVWTSNSPSVKTIIEYQHGSRSPSLIQLGTSFPEFLLFLNSN